MSFGDPNNPYGQQPQAPQGGQPGYGYPQQAPQGIPQQGYGYPQQGAPAGFPGGYPGAPVEMPGGVKGARIMLYILGVCQAVFALVIFAASAWVADQISTALDSDATINSADADKAAAVGAGFVIFFGVLCLLFGLWGILTAAKLGKGRTGIRVSGIVYASLVTLVSVVNLLGANLFALVSLVLGILVIVFLAKSDASEYFNRPRH
ncbi:integral membrane protein [Streptomyces xanthophaeus]|uniref:Uncharacterized protein n=1 Tax=Streptomyces xanthophaeus TaxID=67385 RepID=A0A919H1M0_9ACTN|nr:integral membrane protein [Streptomyces xanthophaeus]GHI87869.1 hypothetical protein Sxan_52330 [Streptomyces xanthophaeus]